MSIEAMKQALEAFRYADNTDHELQRKAIVALEQAIEQAQKQESITVLPDGSAFAVMSWPLPKDHWLYAEREYRDGEFEPVELGKPILTHSLRKAVVSAVRYAIRGATNCGKDVDFDPDALVQNAVYALCGPYGKAIEQAEHAPICAHGVSKIKCDFCNQAEQAQPVAWRYNGNLHEFDPRDWAEGPVTPLYTAPPQRQPLTDEEIVKMAEANLHAFSQYIDGGEAHYEGEIDFARAIEAAHGIKETNRG
jgi:hypothetical protein